MQISRTPLLRYMSSEGRLTYTFVNIHTFRCIPKSVLTFYCFLRKILSKTFLLRIKKKHDKGKIWEILSFQFVHHSNSNFQTLLLGFESAGENYSQLVSLRNPQSSEKKKSPGRDNCRGGNTSVVLL